MNPEIEYELLVFSSKDKECLFNSDDSNPFNASVRIIWRNCAFNANKTSLHVDHIVAWFFKNGNKVDIKDGVFTKQDIIE
jgi:hypothetical protein